MQHLILVTLLLLISGLAFTVFNWRGGVHMTFSQHAAVTRTATIYYSLLFLVTLPILFTFFVAWYVPENNLPDAFLWFAGTSVVFQIVCTWFPENGGTNTKIHRILTGISGMLLVPLMIIIAAYSDFGTFVRSAAGVALLLMLILLGIALKNQNGYRYALLLQIGYYAAFFSIILISTYA